MAAGKRRAVGNMQPMRWYYNKRYHIFQCFGYKN
ncbi:hypothetical protein COLO4_32954 [Corchorus olitorius]|uniref:Uncharacterized protein n=1 Tax=Corchorus olitorius TaxID=93759 RepID=A0A1R3GX65_9ROSI|nr:hypothetical protein COLO4_32954 [Corchorus olitorius]